VPVTASEVKRKQKQSLASPARLGSRRIWLKNDVCDQLGYRAEAGTWRNIYLTGAQELRHGVINLPPRRFSTALAEATPTSMMLDFAAVRLNPDRAKDRHLVLNIVLSDTKETHLINVLVDRDALDL